MQTWFFLWLKFSSFWWLGICPFVLCLNLFPRWGPAKFWAGHLQKSDPYLKMFAQMKTLLNIMSSSRIKNTVAYLENFLESRLTCFYDLQYASWLRGRVPPIQCWGGLVLLTPDSAACINATHPLKVNESRGSGLRHRLAEHCWQTCTWTLPFSSAELHKAILSWVDAKLCVRFQHWARSLRSSVPLVKLGRCGWGSVFGP